MNIKTHEVQDRPFTDTTNLILVAAAEKGEAPDVTAQYLYRSADAVKEQLQRLKGTGEYEKIKAIINKPSDKAHPGRGIVYLNGQILRQGNIISGG